MHAFSAKGRFAGMLRAVPIHVVTVNAALLGTAIYGLGQAAALRGPRPPVQTTTSGGHDSAFRLV